MYTIALTVTPPHMHKKPDLNNNTADKGCVPKLTVNAKNL